MAMFQRETRQVGVLRDLDLFRQLTSRQLRRIVDRAQLYPMRAGETVMLERYHGEQFLVVLDGRVAITHEGEGVATLTRGDFLGEIGLLHHVDRVATVTAETDVKFLAFDADGFSWLMDRFPELRRRIEAEMRGRLERNGSLRR